MRIYLIVATSLIILASCSHSKHTYRDHNATSDHKATSSSSSGNTSSKSQRSVDKTPLSVSSLRYTASIDHSLTPFLGMEAISVKKATKKKDIKATVPVEVPSRVEAARRYKEISKTQRREFRKAMRHSMRRYVVPSSKKPTKRSQFDS
jgi:hypothetical protein